MEKTPPPFGQRRPGRPAFADDPTQPRPNAHGSALRSQGLPAAGRAQQTSLAARNVAVSDRFSVEQLALPLPQCLKERPLFGSLLQAVVGMSDDEKKEVKDTATRILRRMGLSRIDAANVTGRLNHAERESLCRLFCGEGATVLITSESGRAGFIVLPLCADIALLERLAKLLPHTDAPAAANLLCGAMLALRDTPERAASLLKLYCRLVRHSTVPVPAPPMSLQGLIDRVQARVPGCLTAPEVYVLKQQFEIAAASEADQVKLKTFTASAGSLAADAITRMSDAVSSGDWRQQRDFQLLVKREIEAGGTAKPATVPDVAAAHDAAAAYEQVKDFLPHIVVREGAYVCMPREASPDDEHGTLHPESLKEYLDLVAKVPFFMRSEWFNAFIGYGKSHPGSPFTPEAIRSLWIEFLRANPMEIDAASTNWLATAGADDAVTARPLQGDEALAGLLANLPSLQELQTLIGLNEPGDKAAVQRIRRIAVQLDEIGSKLLKQLESFASPSKDAGQKAIHAFRGRVANTVHRAYSRILAGGGPLTVEDIDAMIPGPQEPILLPDAHHQALLEATRRLPSEQSVGLARRFLLSQLPDAQRKDLDVLVGALELDAKNVSLDAIADHLREEFAGSAPSSATAILLASTLIARLMQRELTDDECRRLAGLAVTLAVSKPGERLTNGLTRFFKQVGEHLLRKGESIDSFDRLFAPLEKGLALRVAPEALASMLPEEQHKAQVALGACFAGRGLLCHDVAEASSADPEVGNLPAPPQLSDRAHRVARGYFYLCLHQHFATLVDPELREKKVAKRYLASAYQDIYRSWPELRGDAPLSDEELRWLQAPAEAAGEHAAFLFPENHPAGKGQARLQSRLYPY